MALPSITPIQRIPLVTRFLVSLVTLSVVSEAATLKIDTPMSPPHWALLQRQLINANTEACHAFFERYFDERGYLLCIERWGGDDGPDDAIENVADWPLLHALGAPDSILHLTKKAWEGHLRQYTEAKTTHVPFARDGMYYKEFPVMFDWQHNGEGLRVFNLQGLSDPDDVLFGHRVRRFAGFYMNEDPGAPNYDPEHRIIRSLFNGSRGPLMRKATALDWTGDPIEVENRFELGHGERNYHEMLAHFKDYTDIVGDHPLNLLSTTLALNAFMLTGEAKYRNWLLEYVDAWRERMIANDSIIPSNIGLDGTIGGETDGKWYGGAYGWGFTVVVPQTGELADRNRTWWSFTGFMNAYLLTGDDQYLDPWRQQFERVNAQMKVVDGRKLYPRMHGDQGWYGWSPEPYAYNALELYYLSMDPKDRARAGNHPWLTFLEGQNADYPVSALQDDLNRVRDRAAAMAQDTTTPDTRLADDPMKYNPASVASLIRLMTGGLPPDRRAPPLHSRVRYFDPVARRAGVPKDVAALVDRLSADSVRVTLINLNAVQARELVIQAGAYAEHRFTEVSLDGDPQPMEGTTTATIRLAPGCGARLRFKVDRYAKPPTLLFPWNPTRSH